MEIIRRKLEIVFLRKKKTKQHTYNGVNKIEKVK